MTNGPHAHDAPASDLVHARLQLALQAAQLGLWDWDVASGGLVWDDASLAMFGLRPAELTGSVADIDQPIHPDDLPAVQAALAEAIETAGTVDVEFRVVWPDGSVRWVYARGRALVDESGAVWRVIGTNVDVTEQRSAAAQRAEDAQRMAGLVSVAQALGDAHSELEVLQVVTVRGVGVLGVQGAVLCLADADGSQVRALTTSFFENQVRADVAELPVDFPLPMVHTTATGTAHFLPDRAAAVAEFPGSGDLYERARTEGSAAVPLRARGLVIGSLSVAYDVPHVWRAADRALLDAFAALTAQALERIRAREAERTAIRASQRLSETLQRSLLTEPPKLDDLYIGVRYQPAAQEAQVGGDWFDAFVTAGGGTTLVIGDVAGHDRMATAGMAQVRNLLRGIAQTLAQPPAAVLSALDRAMHELDVSAPTTAVLCTIEEDPLRPGDGWVLRWSNAGHPPPLLVHPDGSTELLWRKTDLMLGVDPVTARQDHEVVLRPGDTVVLYTDGLTERRGEPLDDGLERLRSVAGGLHQLPTEQLCDVLLERLAADAEDDVALLVLRTRGKR